MEKQRCFISLDLPDGVKEELVKFQNRLEEKELFKGKLTRKENIHLTLKFLGNIENEKIEEIKSKLKKIRLNRFNVNVNKTGVFSKKFVRIIWAATEGDEIMQLQSEIDEKLSRLFSKERRFMGHITIARVKEVSDKEGLIEFLDSINLDVTFTAETFSLIRSDLTSEGPKYTTIERYNLK